MKNVEIETQNDLILIAVNDSSVLEYLKVNKIDGISHILIRKRIYLKMSVE